MQESLQTEEEEEGITKKKKRRKTSEVKKEEKKKYEISLITKKIVLPSVNFNEMDIVKELSLPKFVKKLRVKRLKLIAQEIIFELMKTTEILDIPILKKRKRKRVVLLQDIKFEEIELQNPLTLVNLKIDERARSEANLFKSVEGYGEDKELEGIKESLFDIFFERIRGGQDIGENREPYLIFIFDKNRRMKEIIKSVLQRYIEEMEENFEGFKEITIGKEKPDEESEKRRKREIEEYLDVERKVVIVNLESLDKLKKKELNIISLIDRINELKGKRLGFLVFYIDEKDEKWDETSFTEKEKEIYEFLSHLSYLLNFQIWFSLPEIDNRIVSRLLGLSSTYLERIIDSYDAKYILDSLKRKKDSPSDFFEIGRNIQKRRRMKLKNNSLLCKIVKRNKENESDLHYDLKCLTVFYLIGNRVNVRETSNVKEKYKEITNKIKVEESLPQNQNIIPDIQIDEEVWEIETLFAEGVKAGNPLKKIDETIEKYLNTSIKKINIVLDNLTFYLHLKKIKRKEKFWKEILGKDKIEFWIPDWENFALVPISKEIEEIKKILSALKGKEP